MPSLRLGLMADGPNINGHRVNVRRLEVAIPAGDHLHIVQDRALQLFDAAVAPDEHADRQVIAVGCSLPIDAVTDAALPIRGLSMEHAIATQDLLPGKS